MTTDDQREVEAACESIYKIAQLAMGLARAQGHFDRMAHATPWPNIPNAYIAGCLQSEAEALNYIEVLLSNIRAAVRR